MSKTAKMAGWIVCALFILYMIFKFQYWPGAGPMVILACITYVFVYLPLWLWGELKKSSWKLYSWLHYITLNIWIAGTLFKTMHWPFGGMFYFLLLLFGVILFVFYLIKTIRFKNTPPATPTPHMVFILIIMSVNFFLFARSSVSKKYIAQLTGNNATQVQTTYASACKKNNLLYNSLSQTLSDTQKVNNTAYQKSIELKKYVNEVDSFIRYIQLMLIANVQNVTLAQADSIAINAIEDKLNTDPSTLLLIESTGKYNAKSLKKQLNTFKDSIIKFVPPEKQNFIKEGILLITDDTRDEEGEKLSWEDQHFNEEPIIAVLTTLINLQTEVKFAEQQVLTELFNQAMASQTNNIAAKIAEYGMKYENEKKQKEIELLKKDNEISNTLIETKNKTLQAQEQTITFFVLGMICFLTLIIFIVRNNIQRKKANKILSEQKSTIEKQKHLVEEKQKEILDSIHYAKRIQETLLPSTKYIERKLNELKK